MDMNRSEGRKKSIVKLFSPARIAIVGASPNRHYSQSLIANLRQQGFSDSNIFPINPKYEHISGLKCYPTIEDLDDVPDAVAVLVGREQVGSVIESAGKLGVSVALVIADGYADEGESGRLVQVELGDLASQYEIMMLGPNTLGYVCPDANLAMWCAGTLQAPLRDGGISMVAQSSGMLNVIMGMFGDRQIGVRACVSIGNGAVIGVPDLVSYFVDDPSTRVIALLVESIDRPRELLEALEKAKKSQKPVIALKLGASKRGQLNSVAHTGRLSSPNQGWQAAFNRVGVTETFDIDDFVETITLFDGLRKENVNHTIKADDLGVAFATISGGETSLICDIADREGLKLATLGSDTLTSLREGLSKTTLIGNPLDLQNSRTTRPKVFSQSLMTLASDSGVNVLAVRLNMSLMPSTSQVSLYSDVFEIIRSANVVPLVVSRAYERYDEKWWTLFKDFEVTFTLSYQNSIRALSRYSSWITALQLSRTSPSAVPFRSKDASTEDVLSLSPGEVRQWLDDSGLQYVRSAIADSPEDAAAIANELGYPVVVKAAVPNMVHKTEVGGVVLNLLDQKSVIGACARIYESIGTGSEFSTSSLRFEVQKMIPEGIEIILGMKKDPTWGPLLMVGSGGIYAEILKDSVWELPPISQYEAQRTLEKLRIWPSLKGSRGKPPADIEALAKLVSNFSFALVRDGEWLDSIDLNPVIVGPQFSGVHVVDIAVFGDKSMVEKWQA